MRTEPEGSVFFRTRGKETMPGINTTLISRALGYMMVSGVFLYLFNNYLVYWQDMPGSYVLFSHYGWFGFEALDNPLDADQVTQGWTQVIAYLLVLLTCIGYVFKSRDRDLQQDSVRFAQLSAYIIRASFWSVLLIGFVDMIISSLRVEDFLEYFVGEWLSQQLGRPIFRGTYVHYPLMIASLFFAARFRSISFSWLALMCVLAEFLIVITRFVFSYEQAYMGDVVRFWYIPICWVILMQGMGGRGNSLNSPLLSFEVSQSGYGMYVNYLMAAFLIVFAVSMLIQFVSYLLYNIGQLQDPGEHEDHVSYRQLVSSKGG